jgi:hypothetical protein
VPPTLSFRPDVTKCPICGSKLIVEKTHKKKAATLAMGMFWAKEIVMCCKKCCNTRKYRSSDLARLILPQGRFGYDILVYIGKQTFLFYRNESEIMRTLNQKGIAICRSQVAYLAKKFIVCLAIAHKQSCSAMKKKMNQRGGYILHLDGTSEGDSPHLMSILDGISQIVLDNVKVTSENADQLIPFLQRVKKCYGIPLATVHDMGKAIINAVSSVFKGVPDFICHFHFLRDIGKDLFGKENDIIRKRLRKHAIQGFLRKHALALKQLCESNTQLLAIFENAAKGDNQLSDLLNQNITSDVIAYLLINWALEGKRVGDGYGFPFDRPHLNFYHRIKIIHDALSELRYTVADPMRKKKRLLGKIWKKTGDTINDPTLKKQVTCIQEKIVAFDKLRNAMRIALPEGKYALNDNGDGQVDIKGIEDNVTQYHEWLRGSGLCEKDEVYQKMSDQIEKYWPKLFADPIIKKTKTGPITIYPQRTNNILERFFRDVRKMYRKKSGYSSLSKTLKAMIADTPLVKNMENSEYMTMILDGAKSLEDRFAQIDAGLVRQELQKAEDENKKMHPKIRRIIKSDALPEKLVKMFRNCQ